MVSTDDSVNVWLSIEWPSSSSRSLRYPREFGFQRYATGLRSLNFLKYVLNLWRDILGPLFVTFVNSDDLRQNYFIDPCSELLDGSIDVAHAAVVQTKDFCPFWPTFSSRWSTWTKLVNVWPLCLVEIRYANLLMCHMTGCSACPPNDISFKTLTPVNDPWVTSGQNGTNPTL